MGVRLYVDGALLIDKWFDQSFTTYKAMKTLAAGSHQVKVEYYEHLYGAIAMAGWTSTSSDLVTPTPPASLHATTVSATSAELAWDAATDNVAVVGYEVLQVHRSWRPRRASRRPSRASSAVRRTRSTSGLTTPLETAAQPQACR